MASQLLLEKGDSQESLLDSNFDSDSLEIMKSSIADFHEFGEPILKETSKHCEPPLIDLFDKLRKITFLQTTEFEALESCASSFQNSDDVTTTTFFATVPKNTGEIYSQELLAREDHLPPNFEWVPLPIGFKDSMLSEEDIFCEASPLY